MRVIYKGHHPKLSTFDDLPIGELFSNHSNKGLMIKTAASRAMIVIPVEERGAIKAGDMSPWDLHELVWRVKQLTVELKP